jgi:DNA-binding NarL/FixJ family response regulator
MTQMIGACMTARILIVDDHEIVREGIRTLLGRTRPEWTICGESVNGEQAIEAVKALRPDVVILDITMPKMSGLEAAPKIAKLGFGSRILMFTMHDSERLSGEVRRAEAQGLVLKSQAARDLVRAIDQLLAGGTFFGSEAGPESSKSPIQTDPNKAKSILKEVAMLRQNWTNRAAAFQRCADFFLTHFPVNP